MRKLSRTTTSAAYRSHALAFLPSPNPSELYLKLNPKLARTCGWPRGSSNLAGLTLPELLPHAASVGDLRRRHGPWDLSAKWDLYQVLPT